jgi:phosphopantothenoylcysteine decarboxylase/phosphopantothenate--cysteine ligase
MNDKGAGFSMDTNKVTIIEKNGKTHKFDTKSKKEVSKDIVNLLQNYL